MPPSHAPGTSVGPSCLLALLAVALTPAGGCGQDGPDDAPWDYEVFTTAEDDGGWRRFGRSQTTATYQGLSSADYPADVVQVHLDVDEDGTIHVDTYSFAEVGLTGYLSIEAELATDVFRCKTALKAYDGELEITEFQKRPSQDRVAGVLRDVWFAEVTIDSESMEIWPVPEPRIGWLDELAFDVDLVDFW